MDLEGREIDDDDYNRCGTRFVHGIPDETGMHRAWRFSCEALASTEIVGNDDPRAPRIAVANWAKRSARRFLPYFTARVSLMDTASGKPISMQTSTRR
jgi:hypothetical protein